MIEEIIARKITGLGAVIFGMFLVLAGMFMISHTFILHTFPDMPLWKMLVATWVLSFGWEFTTLMTTVNIRHISSWIPRVLAICSGVIILFFTEAFDFNVNPLILIQRWFLSILMAVVNYIYTELFYKKWSERLETIDKPKVLNELDAANKRLHSELAELKELNNSCQSELNELLAFHKIMTEELTCGHCSNVFPSFKTLHAHKGHCDKNPKKRKYSNNN